MKTVVSLRLSLSLLAPAVAAGSFGQGFKILGGLQPGGTSYGMAISRDGRKIVGQGSYPVAAGYEGFSWTEFSGMSPSGSDTLYTNSIAADGHIIGGVSTQAQPGFYLSKDGIGFYGIRVVDDGMTRGWLSPDGSLVVGWNPDAANGTVTAFKMTVGGAMQRLPDLVSGLNRYSIACASSNYGNVIVGASIASDGFTAPVFWDAAGGIHQIPVQYAIARNTNSDGSLIGGTGPGGTGFLYWRGTGSVSSFKGPSGSNIAQIVGISDDSGLVCGNYQDAANVLHGYIYDLKSAHLYDAVKYLSAHGASPGTWRLELTGVSGDGQVFCGSAYDVNNHHYAFVAYAGPPRVAYVTFPKTKVQGGEDAVANVALTKPPSAAEAPAAVTLSSNDVGIAVPPPSISFGTTQTVQSVKIPTKVVPSDKIVRITATYGSSSFTSPVTILAPAFEALSVAPGNVIGGQTAIGKVDLNKVLDYALSVKLTSSVTSAKVPATVTVPAGATTASFNITTSAVPAVTIAKITATAHGVSEDQNLVINAASLTKVSVSPATVPGGTPSTGTVTLNGKAPPYGDKVSLYSSIPYAASVPSTVTIASGKTSATFSIKTYGVRLPLKATIKAVLGSIGVTSVLTVNPAALSSVTVSPASVVSGTTATGTVTLLGLPPSTGTKVTLLSNLPGIAVVSSSVTVPTGKTTATFAVKTYGTTGLTKVTITASLGSVSKKAVLSVTPASLLSLTPSLSSVVAGASFTLTITLDGRAPPSGAAVALALNTEATTGPASVLIAGQKTSAAVTVMTKSVTVDTEITLTATYKGVTKSCTVKILHA